MLLLLVPVRTLIHDKLAFVAQNPFCIAAESDAVEWIAKKSFKLNLY